MNILAIVAFFTCGLMVLAQDGAPLVPANNPSQSDQSSKPVQSGNSDQSPFPVQANQPTYSVRTFQLGQSATPVRQNAANMVSRIWSLMQGRAKRNNSSGMGWTTQKPVTTTTGEPPEVEEEGGQSTQAPFYSSGQNRRKFSYYDFLNPAQSSQTYYDYGAAEGFGDDSDEEMPSFEPQSHFNHRQRPSRLNKFNRFNQQRPNIARLWANIRRRNIARRLAQSRLAMTWAGIQRLRNSFTTAAPVTSTMATTAEPDDDAPAGQASEQGGQTGGQTKYSGYCFCSPLAKCPMGSVNRGGLCQNFITYFLRTKFQRCCYRPSVARRWQL